MLYFLLPISLFIKKVFPLFTYYLSEIPIYFYIILITLAIIIGYKIKLGDLINQKVIVSVFFIFGLQLIAMLISYGQIDNSVLNKNPIREFAKLVLFFLYIFIHYVVVNLLIRNRKDIFKFIKGNVIALFILLLISYTQFFYLLIPNFFNEIVNFIGKYFESQYSDRNWYAEGSYVQTLHRINGLNPESGYLASQLLIIFSPFLLASIKNKTNIFSTKHPYNPITMYSILISILIILFFAQTTTGIIAIFILFFFFWLSLPIKRKIIFVIGFFLLIPLFYFYFNQSSIATNTLNNYLINKVQTDSTINRTGGTISLLKTWISHFIIGVGWNYHDYYLFKNIPTWATYNNEFQYVFVANNYYPILSIFFGWLTEFGTIPVILFLIYCYNLLRDFREIKKHAYKNAINKNDYLFISSLCDAAHFFVLFYLIISLFSFNWSESIYLIMFFFFVSVRGLIKTSK